MKKNALNKSLFVLFLSLLPALSSCGAPAVIPDIFKSGADTKASETAAALETEPVKIPYKVYAESSKYSLSLYEPPKGRYAGAYLSGVLSEIEDFEAVSFEHAVYVYDLKAGDVFPIRWLLSCMANKKTPYIVINPQNGYNPYDISALSELADEIGRFYVPVFVDLYPNADTSLYDPEEYKRFFKEAYDLFSRRASNAAVVFSTEYTQAASSLYYPGRDYVDWVGINITVTADTSVSSDDILRQAENIYFRFQKEKPLFISSLAVSHISGDNHVYKTEDAANTIRNFYSKLTKDYPRIKGINYININCMDNNAVFSNNSLAGNNCLVTDEKPLLDAYKEIGETGGFNKEIDYRSHTDSSREYFLSPFPAYLYDGEMYVNAETVKQDLNLRGFASFSSERKEIDGSIYYKMNLLEKSSFKKIVRNDFERIIYFNEP